MVAVFPEFDRWIVEQLEKGVSPYKLAQSLSTGIFENVVFYGMEQADKRLGQKATKEKVALMDFYLNYLERNDRV